MEITTANEPVVRDPIFGASFGPAEAWASDKGADKAMAKGAAMSTAKRMMACMVKLFEA